jgi:hypothetical protein
MGPRLLSAEEKIFPHLFELHFGGVSETQNSKPLG